MAKEFSTLLLASLLCKLPMAPFKFSIDWVKAAIKKQRGRVWKVVDVEQLETFYNAFKAALPEILQDNGSESMKRDIGEMQSKE